MAVGGWRLVVGFVFLFLGARPTRQREKQAEKATQRFKLAIKLIKVQAPPMHDNLL